MKTVFFAGVTVLTSLFAISPSAAEDMTAWYAGASCPSGYDVGEGTKPCLTDEDNAAVLLADEMLSCPVADNDMMLDEACLGLVYVEVASFKDMANGGGDSLLVKGRYWTLNSQLKVLMAKLQTVMQPKTECLDAVYDAQLELERAAVAARVVKLPKKEDVAPQSLGALSDSGGLSGLGGLGGLGSGFSLNLDSIFNGMLNKMVQDGIQDLKNKLRDEAAEEASVGRRSF